MKTIHEIYVNALLADATSALDNTTINGLTGKNLEDKLSPRMTPKLAQYIGNNFTVVNHIETLDIFDSGFDATVWKENGTNKFYVSMQNSQGLADFTADIDLTLLGVAHAQLVDMVNWWLKNTTAAGESAKQIEFLNGIFFPTASTIGTGILSNISSISVNGHSLGGHLATAFARLFGQQWTIEHTYTYDSAGFTSASGGIIDTIANLFDANMGMGRFPNANEQSNFFAEHGINVTTQNVFNGQQGQRIALFNEEGIGLANHSMYKLTDSLALGNLLFELDSNVDSSQMNQLFNNASNQADSSLENILDALRRLLEGSSTIETPIGDEGSSATTRLAFHENLAVLRELLLVDAAVLNSPLKAEYQNLRILNVDVSITDINKAKQTDNEGLAYRYALTELNPFVLTGDVDYSVHNPNGELNLYDFTTRQGTMTASYLQDRSDILSWKIQYDNTDKSYTDQWNTDTVDGNWDFVDIAIQINGSPLTLAIDGKGLSLYDHQIIFGSEGADTLAGSGDSDKLYGNAGNDTLTGNAGNDHLEGGAGIDTYTSNTSDGFDSILDTDHLGSIVHNGITLTGGTLVAPNLWKDAVNKIAYTLIDHTTSKDLLITAGSEHLLISDFNISTNDLGIHLVGDQVQPAPITLPESIIPIYGDRIPNLTSNTNPNSPSYPYTFDTLSSGDSQLRVTTTSSTNTYIDNRLYDDSGDDKIEAGNGKNVIYARNGGNNSIVSGSGSDYIVGGLGRDLVSAGDSQDVNSSGTLVAHSDTIEVRDGDDSVLGEAGDDVIDGGTGDDYLVGGAGLDALNGGDGNDQLYAGDALAWSALLSDSGTSQSGKELVAGGAGDDVLVGDTRGDALVGGDGEDVIIGREGNDRIFGDAVLSDGATLPPNQPKAFLTPFLNIFSSIIREKYWPDTTSGESTPGFLGSAYSIAPMLSIQMLDNLPSASSNGNYQVVLSSTKPAVDNWLVPATATVAGISYNDYLYGGSGDDWLFGELGDDLLCGNTGNDVLSGGVGNDIYVVEASSSQTLNDKIVDNAGENNIIVFGTGITAEQIKLFKGSLGLDLGNGNQLHIEGVDDNNLAATSSIQYFEFADGSSLSLDELLARGFDIAGTAGDDTVQGTNVTDRINGGLGNDLLQGGAGDDSYLIALGDGNDVIEDTQGNDSLYLTGNITASQTASQLAAERSNDDLVLHITATDSVILRNWFTQTAGVNKIIFADGTTLNKADMAGLTNHTPVANPDTLSVFEDDGVASVATTTLLANDTDADVNDPLNVVSVSSSTSGIAVSLVNGQVQYNLGNAYQSLGATQSATDSFNYTIADNAGATSNATVTVTITGSNDAPTLSSFAAALVRAYENAETPITFANLQTQGDEADIDGTVDAFVIKAVSTGSLKIGTSAATATAWAAGTNDVVDASHNVYWTPAANSTGALNAFTTVAKDNSGAESATAIQAKVAVTPFTELTDFNGDGKSDLFWTNSSNLSGSLSFFIMNGLIPTVQNYISYNADGNLGQVINTKGDYNGDGNTDLLWWNSNTSSATITEMNGSTIAAQAAVDYAQNKTGWTIADSSADFNADGKSDTLWWNSSTNTISLYLQNGFTSLSSADLTPNIDLTGWSIKSACGDYNGDGNADILLTNAIGSIYMLNMNGTTIASQGYVYEAGANSWGPSTWTVVEAKGDYNGDGKTDILLRDTANGLLWQFQMNGTTITNGGGYGANTGALPLASVVIDASSDFNGDHKSDILTRNTSDSSSLVWLMDGSVLTRGDMLGPYASVDGTWVAQNAHNDVNGDGKADVLWTRADGAADVFLVDGALNPVTVTDTAMYGPYEGWSISNAEPTVTAIAASVPAVTLMGIAEPLVM